MDPTNLQRHQYNTNPDSSFGAVFQLDTLVDVIPGLIYPAWLEVSDFVLDFLIRAVFDGVKTSPDSLLTVIFVLFLF